MASPSLRKPKKNQDHSTGEAHNRSSTSTQDKQPPSKRAKFASRRLSSPQPQGVRNVIPSSEKSKTAKQFNGSSKPEALVDTRTKPDKGKGKAPAPPEEPLPTAYKVIAGSYEKLLYGFEGTISVSESSEGISKSEASLSFNLKPIFMFSAHASHITAVAASPQGGKWLATGSADENIKIWDLRRRFEVGGLQHHNGSITHLGFPSRSHLLSASEDGTLCLFRTRDWVVLRALKGHKARVNSVAVHPTSKVALSVGKDRTVRMWDLMRGRGVASMKLGKEGELIRWSIDGTLSAIQSLATIDVYTIDMLLVHTIAHPSRIHDIKFYKPSDDGAELLLVGAEDRMVSVYTISSDPEKEPTIIARLKGHVNRVKAVDFIRLALPVAVEGRTSTTVACTVSSDGKLHAYDLSRIPDPTKVKPGDSLVDLEPVAAYDSKATRFTCITVTDGSFAVPTEGGDAADGRKRKLDGDDSDDEGSDEDEEGWGSQEDEDEEENNDEEENDEDGSEEGGEEQEDEDEDEGEVEADEETESE